MSDAAPEAAKPAVKGPSPIPLVLGILNLGMCGFLVFHALRPPKPPPAPPTEAEKVAAEDKGGPSVTFEPFIINLNEPKSNRYLKATFELEVADDKAAERLTAQKRVVRDDILRYLSSLAVEQTLGEDNKNKIKQQLVARADHVLGDHGKVRTVYFNEFVVQ